MRLKSNTVTPNMKTQFIADYPCASSPWKPHPRDRMMTTASIEHTDDGGFIIHFTEGVTSGAEIGALIQPWIDAKLAGWL